MNLTQNQTTKRTLPGRGQHTFSAFNIPAKYGKHNILEHDTSPKKGNEKKPKSGEDKKIPHVSEEDSISNPFREDIAIKLWSSL